jgi:hypothetical protein
MAGRIPGGGQSLEEVKLTATTIMAMAEATATVGQCKMELGGDDTLRTMNPSMTMKVTRATTRKEGGWDPPPPW